MSVLYLILPVALILAGAAVAAFIWAARQGQFDDLTTPSMRILEDAEPQTCSTSRLPPNPTTSENANGIAPPSPRR